MGFVNRVAPFAGPTGFILPMTFNDDGKDGAKTGTRGSRPPRSEGLPVQSFRAATGSAEGARLAPSAGAADLEGDAPSPTCQSRSRMLTVCASPDRCCGARSTDDDESIYFPIETGC